MPKHPTAANATPLPAVCPFEHQPEMRALMILPSIPPGHLTYLVKDNAFYPHLREGEFAVVDLSDRQPAPGELFVIAYESAFALHRKAYHLCQLRRRNAWRLNGVLYNRPQDGADLVDDWTACHQVLPRNQEEFDQMLRSGRLSASEGPFLTDHLASKLVGRVVGVFVPKVGEGR